MELLKRLIFGVIALTVVLFFWKKASISEKLETLSIDYRYVNFNKGARFDDQIVFLDIDEYSLKFLEPVFGRWPWPRSAHKDLIEFLMLGEPKAILFDILFTESQKEVGEDKALAEISQNSKIVSHALQFEFGSNQNDVETVPLPLDYQQKFPIHWKNNQEPLGDFFDFQFHDYIKPVDLIYKSTPYIHVVNANSDPDGFYRKIPLLFYYDHHWLPSLTQRAIFSLFEKPTLHFEKKTNLFADRYELRIFDHDVLKKTIPLKKSGEFGLHYYSSATRPLKISYDQAYSYAKKIQANEVDDIEKLEINPLRDFKNKIIVIGASATGLEDLKTTPIDKNYPGLLLHATAISNILQNSYLIESPFYLEILIAIGLILIIYVIVFFGQNFIIKSALPLVILSLHVFIGLWLFQKHDYQWPMMTPLLFGILAYGDAIVFLTMVERKQRKEIAQTLSKYLSPEMTRYFIESGINPTAEIGKKQELTILFSDIRGFTSLSESLSPEVLVGLLNEYLAQMTSLIFLNKGTLDKFIGDAVMAFWGAPGKCDEHAELAVQTAMEMVRTLKVINESWIKKGLNPISIGIGINTGSVIVGNIGSEMRLDYTVIGDNVNLASRIEGLTKQYTIQILIGQGTYEQVKNKYLCRPIDYVIVKGKIEPVLIYEPLVLIAHATPKDVEFVEVFQQALNLYYQGFFKEALEKFKIFETDNVAIVFILRCTEFITSPPPDWNGVFVSKMK